MALSEAVAQGDWRLAFIGRDAVRKVTVGDQPLFDVKGSDAVRYNAGPGGALMWNFSLELKRTEAP